MHQLIGESRASMMMTKQQQFIAQQDYNCQLHLHVFKTGLQSLFLNFSPLNPKF